MSSSQWIDFNAAAKELPAEKMTSWFDYYLTGYVWDQPTVQLSHIKAISEALPGALKYFIADSLINALIPALY